MVSALIRNMITEHLFQINFVFAFEINVLVQNVAESFVLVYWPLYYSTVQT